MTGLGALVRLALRRDRVLVPVWVLVLGLVPASTASAYDQLYPDPAARATLNAGTGSNPSIAVLYGRAYDLTTAGGFAAWRYGVVLALLAGLIAIFTVTRHTRAEEDSGRSELLGSAVVGRRAPLTAALLVAGGQAVATGLLVALGMVATGLPAAGALVFGAGIAGAGVAFAAVAAVTAQLTGYSRSANGLACGVLGAAFLVRAVGDSNPGTGWLSWLSPLSWTQLARPFAGERPWVLLLPLLVAAVGTASAFALLPRRDLGSGLWPARLGPPTAPRSLSSPLGLAWRLHRGALAGWTTAMLLIGAVLGSIADGIQGLLGDSAQVRDIFTRMGGAQGIVDTYLALIAGLFGAIAAVHAVLVCLRMRTEEAEGRADPVLATATSRTAWTTTHLLFALLGPAALLTAAGLGAGLAHGLRAGDLPTQLTHATTGALAQLPAVWLIAAIAALAFALLPRAAAPLSWTTVGLAIALTLFGPALNLPQPALDLSPFTHIPKIPGPDAHPTPLIWLTTLAAALLLTATLTFRRRDIG
ncbi:ABC transporter permease [Actinokineospora bangkokensis]|uniref:ABC transporter permease n=1 Tax=Actinokineospora bangkokensis TaxID=1193682 RepID=A0A1Q9LHE6_9PSEU|nr:ABC transporter permease [Actinokineospora bangkokensis]OLR91434.1 ABC transporter permease [Actinokineospora bangkokensis]